MFTFIRTVFQSLAYLGPIAYTGFIDGRLQNRCDGGVSLLVSK